MIQNTRSRNTKVINLKLDELIHIIKDACTSLANLENLSVKYNVSQDDGRIRRI